MPARPRASAPIAWGEAVARERGWKRMTQAELAAAAGVNPSMISLIESDRRLPSLDSLAAIARGLGVPLWKLVHLAETGDFDHASR